MPIDGNSSQDGPRQDTRREYSQIYTKENTNRLMHNISVLSHQIVAGTRPINVKTHKYGEARALQSAGTACRLSRLNVTRTKRRNTNWCRCSASG